MSSGRFLCSTLLCFSLLTPFASAQSNPSTATATATSTWLDILRDLPVVNWFSRPQAANLVPKAPVAACSVTSLPPIADSGALAFENGTDQTSVDVTGLTPAMVRALERFRHMVMAVGGTFDLKSAYRPEAYQEHLQEVWFKWMEIRNNREPGCEALRAQVGEEFARHHLLDSQKPVTSSDHTRGLAFDAVVIVPKTARLNRRRVNLNRLTLLAGLKRPDIFHDPVHFKLAVPTRGGRHV